MGGRGSRSRLARTSGTVQIDLANGTVQDDSTSGQTNQNVSDIDSFRSLSIDDAADYANDIRLGQDWNYYTSNGMNPNNTTQALVENLGLHEKPVVLSDADYDSQWKANALNGVELYRGLGYNPTGEYQQQMLYGDKVYIGGGVHGEGIYMTTSTNYATSYAGSSYSTETVTGFIDKSKANVITETALQRMYNRESSDVRYRFRDPNAYALYKGYNVIHCVGGNGGSSMAYGKGRQRDGYMDFYLPLTRSVLVFREHTRIH